MGAFAWKWQKDPKPEALETLAEDVLETVYPEMKRLGPVIARKIRNRIKTRGILAKDGKSKPIPPYSKGYVDSLGEAGEPTKPDYTRSGTLLAHLAGRRIITKRGELILRIAPHGRASSIRAEQRKRKGGGYQTVTRGNLGGKGKSGRKNTDREGYWYRAQYTYFDRRRRKNVTVPGTWIKKAEDRKATAKSKKKRVIYNAHLANRLAMRLGRGLWLGSYRKNPPAPLVSITASEFEAVRKLLRIRASKAARVTLREVAGG